MEEQSKSVYSHHEGAMSLAFSIYPAVTEEERLNWTCPEGNRSAALNDNRLKCVVRFGSEQLLGCRELRLPRSQNSWDYGDGQRQE